MTTWLRRRITYANTTATLALIIALGGSAYAALRLPANSVGGAQIRTGAVSSRHIRDRSIRLSDLGASTRRALRDRPEYFAVVAPDGTFVHGNATRGGHTAAGSGIYTVGFAHSISRCAATATPTTSPATPTTPGHVTIADQRGEVQVRTFDASGAPTDLPFALIVTC